VNVIFFARKTLLDQSGGDTVQVLETIKALKKRGHNVILILSVSKLNKEIRRSKYDVIHSINLGRYVDQYHCYQIRKKYPQIKWVISSILVDYKEYEIKRGFIWKYLPYQIQENIKVFLRALLSKDRWPAIRLIFSKNPLLKFTWTADHILTTTSVEAHRIKRITGLGNSVKVVPPGLEHLSVAKQKKRNGYVVLGRIEGIKNQIEAINAWKILHKRGFAEPLTIIGDEGSNHKKYTQAFKLAIKEAQNLGVKVSWKGAIKSEETSELLSKTYGVIIPSLFETFGLTSIEGLQAKCQVILSENAESSKELEKHVFLCMPAAEQIANSVLSAHKNPKENASLDKYSWHKAAEILENIYSVKTRFIALSGSRGMPNRYGGFEEMVDHVSRRLSDKGNRVWVSTSSKHPKPDYQYPGILRKFHWDPETLMGPFAQFIYDWISIRSINQWKPDSHITLGTTSSSPSLLFQKWFYRTNVAVHLDGIEWKRGKYSRIVRNYLKLSEQLAVKSSEIIISDNPGITDYCNRNYEKPIREISYGTEVQKKLNKEELHDILIKFGLRKDKYALIICRLVPENNILEILTELIDETPIAIVGNWSTRYSQNILNLFHGNLNFVQIESEYDPIITQALRQGSSIYIHGHSVGGTNPGLLQAMSADCKIVAHDNIFNRSVLGSKGVYFNTSYPALKKIWLKRNSIDQDWKDKLKTHNWNEITEKYAEVAEYLVLKKP